MVEQTAVVPEAGSNVDAGELERFNALASRWWDPEGELRTLHWLNPARLRYIDLHSPVAELDVLDIGCGGGLLCEALATRGARVTGIDMGEDCLQTARLHLAESGLQVEYLLAEAEALAAERAGRYDVVCCLELLEHVPRPADLVCAAAALTRPGGALYFSTLNRHPLCWLTAVLGAEYLLGLLPRGTHDYQRFIRPSELGQMLRAAGVQLADLSGFRLQPLERRFRLHPDVRVNYIAYARKAMADHDATPSAN